ncbi:MAG TPA: efflux RND transporter periplasmic adaptor subunit [Ignavibacteriaceae bacterium]|jgi:HlyD family secretion protein|nr:efflux RND transporter periplasmic adaptor subunit [Ignavibacteriaceae bacterium]
MANGKTKKSKKKLYIFGGIGVLVVALILIALIGGSKEEIIPVQVEKVVKRDITQTVSATGKINPEFQVVITPEVTGEIVSLPVKEGNNVKKGDLLIKIKADSYVAQKDRADANLLGAKATLAMRKAELDKLTSDYNRVKELQAKGLSSDSELEAAKSSYLSSQANYEAAQANVSQMEAALKESMEQLNKTTIYSPMTGTITKLNVELGERVLGSGFSQGTDMMTVSDLGNIEASVDVDENDVVLVSIGDTAVIKVDAFGDRVFKGKVTEIGNSAISEGLGTQEQVVNFDVKIKLFNPDDQLRPGMSCNADVQTETKHNVVAVPIQSVTARNKAELTMDNEDENNMNVKEEKKNGFGPNKLQEIVFIIKNNKAKTVNVETGISDDNFIEVKSGLDTTQQVVSGSYRAISKELADGSNVRVEEKSQAFGSNNK